MNSLLKKHKAHFQDIDELYDYQAEVFEMLLRRKNTLAIIPTGGGKSLLYQLLSLELEGITLVISPLLALMKEQVTELNGKRNISAISISSDITFVNQREILRNLNNTSFKMMYVSPERLQNPFFQASLIARDINVSMIVVDEAHCISQWGSSFRPDYGQINGFVNFLKTNGQNPFLLCLTATLSQTARKDIVKEFNVSDENIYVSPKIIRDNLKLNFEKVELEDEKEKYLREFLAKHKPKKTIAYLYSKYLCENYADTFSDEYSTDYFHADVDSDEKEAVYTKFLNNEIDILFATTAFGMGINIPDIESIVHIHIPNSIEEYYQQAGRGWRKKTILKDCNCLALWSDKNFEERQRNLNTQKFTIDTLNEGFKLLLGRTKFTSAGQIVNKDKNALRQSGDSLQLLRYKLEKYQVIRTIGEMNGSPLSIELHENTPLWNKVIEQANNGMDSFGYVSKQLGVHLNEIIAHIHEQDLKNNVKTLPATRKDIYFEVLIPELDTVLSEKIITEINEEVDFRMKQLQELMSLFSSENFEEILRMSLI